MEGKNGGFFVGGSGEKKIGLVSRGWWYMYLEVLCVCEVGVGRWGENWLIVFKIKIFCFIGWFIFLWIYML